MNNITFRLLTLNDIEWFNSIRNTYCEKYLHNSTKFTNEQAKEWFVRTNPEYYVIINDGIDIGYFRTSDYSKENKKIQIGADIHPDFLGKGLGYKAYKSFIPYSFDKYDLNKIYLEVLATNHRAIHLYEKLGFVLEGIKREDILKNDIFVNSLIYSMLKSEI